MFLVCNRICLYSHISDKASASASASASATASASASASASAVDGAAGSLLVLENVHGNGM